MEWGTPVHSAGGFLGGRGKTHELTNQPPNVQGECLTHADHDATQYIYICKDYSTAVAAKGCTQ